MMDGLSKGNTRVKVYFFVCLSTNSPFPLVFSNGLQNFKNCKIADQTFQY